MTTLEWGSAAETALFKKSVESEDVIHGIFGSRFTILKQDMQNIKRPSLLVASKLVAEAIELLECVRP